MNWIRRWLAAVSILRIHQSLFGILQLHFSPSRWAEAWALSAKQQRRRVLRVFSVTSVDGGMTSGNICLSFDSDPISMNTCIRMNSLPASADWLTSCIRIIIILVLIVASFSAVATASNRWRGIVYNIASFLSASLAYVWMDTHS